ncbi:MAG: thiamine phosphate synthase [Pseudomonadota bacterium]
MSQPEQPQLYIVTPEAVDHAFADTLAAVLDTHPAACVRLDLATRDEDRIARAADALREVTHARDVALVVTDRVALAERLGLDGVHLSVGGSVRDARKALGTDAIVGAHAGSSRHDGMTAGEAGADYIAFDASAGHDLFAWWTEMIELPIVAEGALTQAAVRTLAPVTDFFAIGDEIWSAENPAKALNTLLSSLG